MTEFQISPFVVHTILNVLVSSVPWYDTLWLADRGSWRSEVVEEASEKRRRRLVTKRSEIQPNTDKFAPIIDFLPISGIVRLGQSTGHGRTRPRSEQYIFLEIYACRAMRPDLISNHSGLVSNSLSPSLELPFLLQGNFIKPLSSEVSSCSRRPTEHFFSGCQVLHCSMLHCPGCRCPDLHCSHFRPSHIWSSSTPTVILSFVEEKMLRFYLGLIIDRWCTGSKVYSKKYRYTIYTSAFIYLFDTKYRVARDK